MMSTGTVIGATLPKGCRIAPRYQFTGPRASSAVANAASYSASSAGSHALRLYDPPMSARGMLSTTNFSGSRGIWKKNMYQDFANCAGFVANACASTDGGGQFIATRRSTRSGCRCATVHATPPPQSWPTTMALSAPRASIMATTSSARSAVAYEPSRTDPW